MVALHHSGVPETKDGRTITIDGKPWDSSIDESRIKWKCNEGIRISSIVEFLRARKAAEPLAQAVLGSPREPIEVSSGPDAGPGAWGRTEIVKDELQMTIPVRLAVRLGQVPGGPAASGWTQPSGITPSAPASSVPVDGMKAIAIPSWIESVKFDQSN